MVRMLFIVTAGGGVLGGLPYTKPAGLSANNGIVAFTTGASQAGQSNALGTFGLKHPVMVPLPSTGLRGAFADLGTVVIDVTQTSLTAAYICTDGRVLDSFVMNKN